MSLAPDLATAQELLSTLQEVSQMLGVIEGQLASVNKTVGASTTAEVAEKIHQTRIGTLELYIVLRRTTQMLRRLGLPDEVGSAISLIQQAITAAYILSAALRALETTGTWGLVKGIMFLLSGLSMIVPTMIDSKGYRR